MQHGFQRLVLLWQRRLPSRRASAGWRSLLVAPNNTGKTSLINAPQFLADH